MNVLICKGQNIPQVLRYTLRNRHESKRRLCSHRRMRSRWGLGGRVHSSKVARGIAVGFSRDVH